MPRGSRSRCPRRTRGTPRSSSSPATRVLFESGQVDCFNVCEWGAIKRSAVEAGPEAEVILGFRESVTAMGIVARKDSGITRPEELAGVPVAVQQHTGSHYVAIRMMEGFVPKNEIETVHIGGPLARLRALLDGTVQAAALMEPFLSYAEKDGYLVTMAYYNGLVVAPEDYDEIQFQQLQKIVERAVDRLNADPASTHRCFSRTCRRICAPI